MIILICLTSGGSNYWGDDYVSLYSADKITIWVVDNNTVFIWLMIYKIVHCMGIDYTNSHRLEGMDYCNQKEGSTHD